MSTEKYPWPQWQLTAFVLNELEPDVAGQIQSAAESDPSLATEIAAIRATVAQVTQLYKHESAGIEPTTFVPAATSSDAILLTASANDPIVFNRTSDVKVNWAAAIGLLAMAASLLTAVVLAAPALQSYFAQSNDVLANADYAQRMATAESTSPELTRQFGETKSELSKEQAARRAGSKSEMPQTDASTAILDKDVSRSGDAPSEYIEEIDLATKEGSKPDFEGTTDHFEKQKSTTQSGGMSTGKGQATTSPEVADASEEQARQIPNSALAKNVGASTSTSPQGPFTPTADNSTTNFSDAPVDALTDSQLGGRDDSPKKGAARGKPALESKAQRGGMGGMEVGGMGVGGMGVGGMGGMGAQRLGAGGVEGEGATPAGYGTPEGQSQGRHLSLDLSLAEPSPGPKSSELATYLHDDVQYEGELRDESQPAPFRRKILGRESGSDRYAPIYENPFKSVESDPLTTFSIDVDTASYVKARQFLTQSHSLPPANAVRVEEFINYFEYEYAGPQGDDPFAANLAVATCPWRTDHKLVRIALQAKKMDVSERPKANIVFLLDVSGSMDEPNKLPLVKESMRMLIQQLGENDRVAMVVYAGAAGCVLESTTGDKQDVILGALDRLNAGGSTNGGQGIQLAYDIARDHFVHGGVNRVILCTDGDFNVGTTSTEGLVNLVVENAKSKVFLTVLGFGMGNTNDAMMEQISDKGNGVYGFVDSRREAQRQMIKQLAGNLMTVAKDVKIQVEFNPERVASYRLIGYENRKLANEDFANDKKDAGEIGAGHRVTALYEIEPLGASKVQPAEGLRYQKRKTDVAAEPKTKTNDEGSNELLAVSLRYKQPEGDTSKLLTFPLVDGNKPFAEADQDFKWAASVAQFAMLLRTSTHKGNTSWSGLIETAESLATDESRRECVGMIRTAAGLSGR